jgi:hypothetical protein
MLGPFFMGVCTINHMPRSIYNAPCKNVCIERSCQKLDLEEQNEASKRKEKVPFDCKFMCNPISYTGAPHLHEKDI